MNYPVQPIEIVSTPTDYITIIASFAAAFLGAGAAFAFKGIDARLRERKARLAAVNSALYSLIVTQNNLVNIKSQFLTRFQEEFEATAKLITEIEDPNSQPLRVHQVEAIFGSLQRQDPHLNNLCRHWEEPEFLALPKPEEPYFTVDGAPDLVRLLMTCRSQIVQIQKKISVKNTIRERMLNAVEQEGRAGGIGLSTLTFWLEMISYRTVVLKHVDTALALSVESAEQITAYRADNFRKSLITKIFVGKEVWVEGGISDQWKGLLPKKEDYVDIIQGKH
jgi:hypothetical protein